IAKHSLQSALCGGLTARQQLLDPLSDLRGATLRNARLTDLVYLPQTRWPDGFDPRKGGVRPIEPKADLRRLHLDGANLSPHASSLPRQQRSASTCSTASRCSAGTGTRTVLGTMAKDGS